MVKEIKNVVTWLKNWFYDKNEVYQKNETYTKSEVDSSLNTKLNSNLTVANKMLVTDNNGNVVLDDKPTFEAIKIVASLPTASASTMGALYIVSENSKVNVYYTRNNNGSYSWQKMDTDILDELSIGWNDITGKPSSFPPANHASTATTYGVGTTINYGHNKIINDLNKSSLVNGESLSAHQGYVLKNLIQDVVNDVSELQIEFEELDASEVPFSPGQIWGDESQVVTNVEIGLDFLRSLMNSKQNKGDCVTSIALVPKSTDSTGAIKLYYGDEP